MNAPRRHGAPIRRVAVIGPADANRRLLAKHVTKAGFDVHECDELGVPTAFVALVVIGDAASTIGHVRACLRISKRQRIIAVTPDLGAFRDLLVAFEGRLFALPATAAGWEVVELLRETGGTSSPGTV